MLQNQALKEQQVNLRTNSHNCMGQHRRSLAAASSPRCWENILSPSQPLSQFWKSIGNAIRSLTQNQLHSTKTIFD